jgi:hypothetical protein
MFPSCLTLDRGLSRRFRVLVCSTLVLAASALPLFAAEQSAEPASSGTLESPVSTWLHDRIVQPVQPFELVPGKDPDGWGFMIEPYGWSPGLYGRIGLRSIGLRRLLGHSHGWRDLSGIPRQPKKNTPEQRHRYGDPDRHERPWSTAAPHLTGRSARIQFSLLERPDACGSGGKGLQFDPAQRIDHLDHACRTTGIIRLEQ